MHYRMTMVLSAYASILRVAAAPRVTCRCFHRRIAVLLPWNPPPGQRCLIKCSAALTGCLSQNFISGTSSGAESSASVACRTWRFETPGAVSRSVPQPFENPITANSVTTRSRQQAVVPSAPLCASPAHSPPSASRGMLSSLSWEQWRRLRRAVRAQGARARRAVPHHRERIPLDQHSPPRATCGGEATLWPTNPLQPAQDATIPGTKQTRGPRDYKGKQYRSIQLHQPLLRIPRRPPHPVARDTTNGITDFFAHVGNFGRVNTNELCVDDICVTRDQFAEVFGGSQSAAAAGAQQPVVEEQAGTPDGLPASGGEDEGSATTTAPVEEPASGTSSTDQSSFTSRFFASLVARLTQWFADTTTGITDFFAHVGNFGRVNTNELCVDDICVTRDQFAEVFGGSSQSAAAAGAQQPVVEEQAGTPDGLPASGGETRVVQQLPHQSKSRHRVKPRLQPHRHPMPLMNPRRHPGRCPRRVSFHEWR